MNDKEFFIDTEMGKFSRYDLAKFLEFNSDVDTFDPLTSSLLDNLQSLEVGGYFKVQGEDGKPWLISQKIYNDANYGMILMFYNGFSEISDIVTGSIIKYPSINALEDFYFTLKTKSRG